MEEAETRVKEWAERNSRFVTFLACDPSVFTFTLITGLQDSQKPIFQILCEPTWAPLFIMCDDPSMEEWVARVNTFAQRRQPLTLPVLLLELETSLKLHWKIAEPPKPPPSVTFTPPSAPMPPIPVPAPPAAPPRTIDDVRAEIAAWSAAHTDAHLQLVEVRPYEDGINQVLAMSAGEPPLPFELICSPEWNLIALNSSHEGLSKVVEQLSGFISQTRPDLSSFLDDFARLTKDHAEALAAGSIEEITAALAALSTEDESEEATWTRTVATPQDWDTYIFPELHRFMADEGLEIWQIDEWLRQVRQQYNKSSGERNDVLQFIIHNIFHGNNPPRSIRKFFPKPQSPAERLDAFSNWKFPPTSSPQARELLKAELKKMEEIDHNAEGFVAYPLRNQLFHWEIKLFNFDQSTQLGQELVAYTLNAGADDKGIYGPGGKIKPYDIVVEVKFPPQFPAGRPHFRVVKPRFVNEEGKAVFEFNEAEKHWRDLDEDTEEEEKEHVQFSLPEGAPSGANALSFSMALERKKWLTSNVPELIRQLRKTLIRTPNLHIDINSSKRGIPTEGSFWEEYVCVSAKEATSAYDDAALGGKVLLPGSALNQLMGRAVFGGGIFGGGGSLAESGGFGDSPMIFEIAASSGRRSFVGVMEFRAPEGHVGLPLWMMRSLGVSRGQVVQVRRVTLPKGLFFELQPHSASFKRVQNVKAMMEWVLRRFVAVSEGDELEIEHDGKTHKFSILRCTPERAIAITDADVSVNFADPLNADDDEAVDEKAALTRSQEIRLGEEELEKKRKEREGATLGTFLADKPGEEGKDFKTCPNCRARIPIGNTMHELTCSRRNWYCEDCKMVVLKTEMDAHLKEFHAPVTCDWCNVQVEKRHLFNHKKNDCPGRSVTCKYCELKLIYRQLWEHERSCGAVTEKCPKCGDRYPRRELQAHDRVCTGTGAPAEPSPFGRTPPARSPLARRPSAGQDFMTCEKCSAPFTAFDDLQVHVLTEHADESEKFALFGGTGFK